MKPILKWQYDQLIKQLLLLQEHWGNQDCPCHSDGEMCLRKHLLTIEAYAEETIPIEDSRDHQDQLGVLAGQAIAMRAQEEKSLCGQAATFPEDPGQWARKWRKKFEAYSLACAKENHKSLGSCIAQVKAKIKSGELPKGTNPRAICQGK